MSFWQCFLAALVLQLCENIVAAPIPGQSMPTTNAMSTTAQQTSPMIASTSDHLISATVTATSGVLSTTFATTSVPQAELGYPTSYDFNVRFLPSHSDIQTFTTPGVVSQYNLGYAQYGFLLNATASGATAIDIDFSTFAVEYQYTCWQDYLSIIYVENDASCLSGINAPAWTASLQINQICGPDSTSYSVHDSSDRVVDLSANTIRIYSKLVMVTVNSYSASNGIQFSWRLSNDLLPFSCSDRAALLPRPMQPYFDYGVQEAPPPVQTFTQMEGTISHLNYGPNEALSWLLKVPSDTGFKSPRVRLIFNDTFEVDQTPNCAGDYVELLSLSSCHYLNGLWSSITPDFCGTGGLMSDSHGNSINSADRVWVSPAEIDVMVVFRSDSSSESAGFIFYWDIIDAGTPSCYSNPQITPDPNMPKDEMACTPYSEFESAILETSQDVTEIGSISFGPVTTGGSKIWKIPYQDGYTGTVKLTLLDIPTQNDFNGTTCASDQYAVVGYTDYRGWFCPTSRPLCGSTVQSGAYQDSQGSSYDSSSSWLIPSSNIVIKWFTTIFSSGISFDYSFDASTSYPKGVRLRTVTGTSMTIDFSRTSFPRLTNSDLFTFGSQVGWVLIPPTKFRVNPIYRLRIWQMWTDTSYGMYGDGTMMSTCYSFVSNLHIYQYKNPDSPYFSSDFRLCGQPGVSNNNTYYSELGSFGPAFQLGFEHISQMSSSQLMIVYEQNQYSSANSTIRATLDLVLPGVKSLGNVSNPYIVPVGETVSFPMPSFMFSNCYGCAAEPSSWNVSLANGRAIPNWMKLIDDSDGSKLLEISPNITQPVIATRIKIIACNEYDLCDATFGDVRLIQLSMADRTSTLSCPSRSLYVQPNGSPATMDCIFLPRKLGALVAVSVSSLTIGLTGSGYISEIYTETRSTFADKFFITYIAASNGGFATITEKRSNTTFDFMVFKHPDDTTLVACKSTVLTPNQPVDCTITPRNNKNKVLFENILQGGNSSFFDLVAVDASNQDVPITVSSPTPIRGSSFTVTITSGLPNLGKFNVRARLNSMEHPFTSQGLDSVYVVGIPDMTSSFECYDSPDSMNPVSYVPSNRSVTCQFLARRGSSAITASASDFRVRLSANSPAILKVQNASVPAGDRIPFQITGAANSNGTATLRLFVRGQLNNNADISLTVVQLPAYTKLSCESPIFVGSQSSCTIKARSANGRSMSVLGASFTLTKDTRLGSFSPITTISGQDAYSLADQFSFSFNTFGGNAQVPSSVVTIKDGFSGVVGGTPAASVYIYAYPDSSTLVNCGSGAVFRGKKLTCIVTPRQLVGNSAKEIVALAGAFTAQSSLGSVSGVVIADSGVGAGKKFSFDFTAIDKVTSSALPTGLVSITVSFKDCGACAPVSVTIAVIDSSSPSSAFTCASVDSFTALSTQLCSIKPMDSQQRLIYAAASDFTPFVNPDPVTKESTSLATFGSVFPANGNKFFFTINPLKAWQPLSIRVNGTNSQILLNTMPAVATFSWYSGDSSTEQIATIGRDLSSTSASQPGVLDSPLAQELLKSMACSMRFCAAVTAGGRLLSWGLSSVTSATFYFGRETNAFMGTPIGLTGINFRSVGGLVDLAGYWDSSDYYSSFYALSSDGTLYSWGMNVTSKELSYPIATGTSFKCGLSSTRITAISSVGPVFLAATDCSVYSVTLIDFLSIGRSGIPNTFGQISFSDAPDFTQGVISMFASYYYGIILLGGNQFYTYGSGLQFTGMPSSDSSAALYTFPNDVLPNGVVVTHVEGNTEMIVIQTSNQQLWMMSLAESMSPNGQPTINRWQELDYDFLNQNSYDSRIESISLSQRYGDLVGTLVIALSSGQVYNFDPLSGIPSIISQTTSTSGMAAKFVYSSLTNNFVSMAPQIVIVNSALNLSANAACGTSRVCASLDVALTKFTKPGTIFQLQNGTYTISSTASITAADVKIESVTLNPAFTSISCNVRGPCLSVSGKTFGIRGISLFGANNPSGNGGALTIGANSYATIRDCIFSNNRASDGAALYLNAGSSSVYIQKTIFQKNQALGSGGAIAAEKGAQLLISTSKFTSNNASADGGAMRLTGATVSLASCSFSRNLALASGGAIRAISSSSISGTDITLSDNTAAANGGAIDISESDVTLTSSVVQRNTAGTLGGAFNVQFGSLILTSSIASSNRAGTLGGVAYCISIRNVQLISSTASDNIAGSGGGVFYATFCSPMVVDSTLSNNSAPIGGAAYIASDASSYFVRSTFVRNRATDSLDGGGGAVSFRNALTANITSVTFRGNTAQVRGGAVEFLGNRFSYKISNVNASLCAAPAGGVIYFDQLPPSLAPWRFGAGNYGKHGTNYASTPKRLVWSGKLPKSYNASSAVPFAVRIGARLVDYYNQTVAVDNSTTVTLIGADGITVIVGKPDGILKEGEFNWTENTVGAQLTPSSIGKIAVSSFVTNVGGLITTSIVVPFRRCEPGEFTDRNVKCTECQAGTFSTVHSTAACTPCSSGEFQNATGQTGCNNCSPGSYSQARGQSECSLAQPGFYQPESGKSSPLVCWTNTVTNDTLVAQTTCYCKKNYIQDNNSNYDPLGPNTAENQPYICVDCPVGGNCDTVAGTSFATVLPKDSYQAEVSGYNRSFIKCLNSDQCVYGAPFGSCKNPVFTGHLCTTCAPGYGRNGEFGCSQCPSAVANRLYLTAAVFVGVILISFMVVSAMQASAQPKAVHSILIKIIMSSIQFNSLALSFDYHWPAEVSVGLQTQKKITSVGQSILSVDCFMSESTSTSPFYIQSLLFLFLPLMIAVGPIFFIIPFALYKKFIRGASNVITAARDEYVTSVVVGLFVVHPNIVQQALKMFNCKSLASQPDYHFLVADLRERCWHDEHKKWALLVGLPMVIFWVIGIPLTALYLLYKNRNQLDTQKMKMRYGFLSQGYTKGSYFWEIIVLSRKIILSGIAVFLTSDVTVQSLCALTLCVLALVGHTYYHPFDNPLLDHVEFLSLMNSFVTFMCGQYLFADVGDAGNSVITVIIVLSNIAFFGYAAHVLLRTIIKMQKEKAAALLAKKKGGAGDKAGGNDRPEDGSIQLGSPRLITVRPQQQATAGAALFVKDAAGTMVPLNIQDQTAHPMFSPITGTTILANNVNGTAGEQQSRQK